MARVFLSLDGGDWAGNERFLGAFDENMYNGRGPAPVLGGKRPPAPGNITAIRGAHGDGLSRPLGLRSAESHLWVRSAQQKAPAARLNAVRMMRQGHQA